MRDDASQNLKWEACWKQGHGYGDGEIKDGHCNNGRFKGNWLMNNISKS